jgi:hypothetical protein
MGRQKCRITVEGRRNEWERREKRKEKETREEEIKRRNEEVQEREQMSTFVVLCLLLVPDLVYCIRLGFPKSHFKWNLISFSFCELYIHISFFKENLGLFHVSLCTQCTKYTKHSSTFHGSCMLRNENSLNLLFLKYSPPLGDMNKYGIGSPREN